MKPLAISTHGLAKRFKNTVALDGLDLAVPEGTVFGLLGPNGAGKTTTIQLLLGLLEPSGGTAMVLGLDVSRHGAEVRRKAGALLEHHGLYERFTAHRNLELHGKIHRIPLGERRQRIQTSLQGLGLWDRRDELVATWSKGMKQKLAIARALLHRPPVVFLDEPTAGHDPAAAKEVRDQLRDVVRTAGTTILISTHNLAEAEALCQRVGILQRGRLVAQGAPADLRARARNPRIVVEAGPAPPQVMAKMRKMAHVTAIAQEDGVIRIDLDADVPATPFVKALVTAGVLVEEVRKERATMEETYIELTREAAP